MHIDFLCPQTMSGSTFHISCGEESCDEDHIPCSSSNSSGSEGSCESADESEGETGDENSAHYQGWGQVSSQQRSHSFSGEEGLAIWPQVNSATGNPHPIDMYELFITDDLLDIIVIETNKYAKQKIKESSLTGRAWLHSWKPTTRDEIKKFIGIIVYMSIVTFPELSLYWSKSKLYVNSFVRNLMTRERFEVVLSCLHFRDSTDVNDQLDPLFNLRPLVTAVSDRCQAVYKPGPDIVINQNMVPLRGRFPVGYHRPGKTRNINLKMHRLCTPGGYTCNFMIHAGNHKMQQGLNCRESLALQLCENLLGVGSTLYADHYYCSLVLAEYLLDNRTYLCGTISSTKHLPKAVTEKKLKNTKMKALENSKGVKVFKWKDKQNMLIISTVPEHSDCLVPSGKTNKLGEQRMKPESVIAFNKASKGANHHTSYYSALSKNIKLDKWVAFELIAGLSVVNAWVLHCQYFPSAKMDQLQFRESLVYSLTGIEPEDIRPGKRSVIIAGRRSSHILTEKKGFKHDTRKRCHNCYRKIAFSNGPKVASRKAKKVSTFCVGCEGKPHLCTACFAEIHNV